MNKKMKGISLIVLIVTIIVMIIIAGAIIISLQNSNIIDRAKNATSEYTLKVEKEKIQLALDEWLLEKRTAENPKTFKAFMADALPDDTISGETDGPITIKMSETGNRYNVTSDGKITLLEAVVASELEKYIFGEYLEGKSIMELLEVRYDGEEPLGYFFIDDTSTTLDESTNYEVITIHSYDDDSTLICFTDKTNSENIITYKFIYNVGYNEETSEDTFITDPEYGLEKIYESSLNEGTELGKIVSYDNKLWTIIYDDNVNGLQMICNERFLYNEDEFQLGTAITSIPNWSTTTYIGLDDVSEISNAEMAATSYYHAIDILNAACESVVTSNDNIIDVRCVGSNPSDKDAESTTLYTSTNLTLWPIDNVTYAAGAANNMLKGSDTNYVSDHNRILGLNVFGMNKFWGEDWSFWSASRSIEESSERISFGIRLMDCWASCWSAPLINVGETDIIGRYEYNGLMPVVSLNPNVEFSGSGTADNPYTF